MKRRHSARSLCIVPLGVATWVAIGAAPHIAPARESVAPWDTNDHTNPPKTRLPEPERLIVASGNEAVVGDIRIRFLGINRDRDGREANGTTLGRTWAPSGAPYYGDQLQATRDDWGLEALPGSRYLSFDLTLPKNGEDLTTSGYIPDGAQDNPLHAELHGWSLPRSVQYLPTNQGTTRYHLRSQVVVERGDANRYRFGISRGAWSNTFTTKDVPSKLETRVLGKTAEGTLEFVSNIQPGPRAVDHNTLEYGELNVAHVRWIPSALPPNKAYWVHLYDKSGREIPIAGNSPYLADRPLSSRQFESFGQVVVESRPITYVEFRDVHFDPDPKLWGVAHWGKEGEVAEVRQPGLATLTSISEERLIDKDSLTWDTYTPDGVRWREAPGSYMLSNRTSLNEQPYREGQSMGNLVLDSDAIASGKTFRIEAYAADSSEPGKDLHEKIAERWYDSRYGSQMGLGFLRPRHPYVQFAVRVADSDWKHVGSVRMPIQVADGTESSLGSKKMYVNSLSVIFRPQGSLDMYYHAAPSPTADGTNVTKPNLLRWHPDDEVRLFAKLKSGERVPISFNSWSESGREITFGRNSDKTSPVASFSEGAQVKSIDLKDVSAFEVEKRTLSTPKYLVARVPPTKER